MSDQLSLEITEANEYIEAFLERQPQTTFILERCVEGKRILRQSKQDLEYAKQEFEDALKDSIQSHKNLIQLLEMSRSVREAQASEIVNNVTDIFIPNASQFKLNADLTDHIKLLESYKNQIGSYIKQVKERLFPSFKKLKIGKATLIDREMFKEEIAQFEENIAYYIEQIEHFKTELEEELAKIESSLKLLNQKHRDNGFPITTQLQTIWLEDYRKPDLSNQENN